MDMIYGSRNKYAEGVSRRIRTDNEGNLCVVPPDSGRPFQFFLSRNGAQTGTINANGNYSSSPVDFYYESTGRFEIYSLIVNISDNANFNQEDYGAITGGVTNGVKFLAGIGNGIEVPILRSDVWPIKKNYQWASIASDIKLTSFAGLAQTMIIDFHIPDSYGKMFSLDPGQSVIARLNDDFSGLVSHTFIIRGTLFDV